MNAIRWRAASVMLTGTAATVALVVFALWAWAHAAGLTEDWTQPDLASDGIRAAAIAAAAGAQVILLNWVVALAFPRRWTDATLAVLAGLATIAAACAAAVLAWNGR